MNRPQHGYPGIAVKDLVFRDHHMSWGFAGLRADLASRLEGAQRSQGLAALNALAGGMEHSWQAYLVFASGATISILTSVLTQRDAEHGSWIRGNGFLPSYEIQVTPTGSECIEANHVEADDLQKILDHLAREPAKDEAAGDSGDVAGNTDADDTPSDVIMPYNEIFGSFRFTERDRERNFVLVPVDLAVYRATQSGEGGNSSTPDERAGVAFFNRWCATHCRGHYSWVGFYVTWAFERGDDAEEFRVFIDGLSARMTEEHA